MSNARERLAPLTGPRNSVGRLIAGEKVVAAGATTDLNRGGAVNGNSTTASRSWTQGNKTHRDEAKKHGWLLEQHQSPTEVPMLRRGLLVLLDNQGGWERTEEAA